MVYEGALSDLRRQGGARYRLRTTDDAAGAATLLRSQPGVDDGGAPTRGLEFQAQEHDVGEVSLALGRAGIAILALTPELASLEDLFFRLTEGAPDGGPASGRRQRQRRRRRGRPPAPRRGGGAPRERHRRRRGTLLRAALAPPAGPRR